MRNSYVLLVIGLALLLIVAPVMAQKKVQKTQKVASYDANNVHLFQSYFYDAPITKAGYGQGGLTFADFEYSNSFSLGVMGGYPINDKIEAGAQLHYISVSPDEGDGESGISDLGVFGRYNLYNQNQTNLSVGAMATLPIGEEKIGQSKLNFGAFGAVRHGLNNGMTLVGTIGLMFFEKKEFEINFLTGKTKEKTSYDNYLNLGFGTIYQVNSQLNIIGELSMQTEFDYMMLSGGADYKLSSGHLRGALGIGLDDGAPDLMIMGGYQISF